MKNIKGEVMKNLIFVVLLLGNLNLMAGPSGSKSSNKVDTEKSVGRVKVGEEECKRVKYYQMMVADREKYLAECKRVEELRKKNRKN